MNYEAFYAIVSAVIFPFIATGAITWLTLGRRGRPLLAAIAWIAAFALAFAVSYVSVDLLYGIEEHPLLGSIRTNVTETTGLICMMSFTAVWTATTLICHSGTLSSKLMVSLVFSSICITVLAATDAVYSLAIGTVFTLDHLKAAALIRMAMAAAVFVPLAFVLPRRMRAMIDRTDGKMAGYLPIPILIFAVTTAELYMKIYFDSYTRQGMYGTLGICILTGICLFLLMRLTSGSISISGYRRELDAARVIQESALGSQDSAAGLDVDAVMIPAKDVAGDFYSIVDMGDGRTGIVIADVSDKGIPAAMFMMRAKTLIDERLAEGKGPAECLTEVNEALMRDNSSCMFVTVLIAVHDGGGRFRMASAGHPFPLLKRRDGVSEIPVERGPMLGLLPHEYTESGFRMEREDVLLMFTDGATDCEDSAGDQFGMERLEECFGGSGGDPCGHVADRLREFSRGTDFADDATLVSIAVAERRPAFYRPGHMANHGEIVSNIVIEFRGSCQRRLLLRRQITVHQRHRRDEEGSLPVHPPPQIRENDQSRHARQILQLQIRQQKSVRQTPHLGNGLLRAASQQVLCHTPEFRELRLALPLRRNKRFSMMMSDAASGFRRIEHSPLLSSYERSLYRRMTDCEMDRAEFYSSVPLLCRWIENVYGKEVVILIDEYDKPVNSSVIHGYYRELTADLRPFLESALKNDTHYRFAVMTGVSRITKESIFSGLNNLNEFDIFNSRYDEYFGFNEDEVERLLDDTGLDAGLIDSIREYYDGYRFGDCDIYNPFSVMRCLEAAYYGKPGFEPHWVNSGTRR